MDKALTLPDVISIALDQNLSLQRAGDQVVLAKSRYRQQWAAFLPSAVVRAEQRSYRLFFIEGSRSITPQVELNVSVPANQPLFIRESHRWYDAAVLDRTTALQDVLALVANTYYDALEARLLVLNAELGITEARQQLSLAQNGKHGGEDLSRAEAQYVQQQRRLTTAVNRQAQTLQALRNVLNQPPEAAMLLDHTGPLTPLSLVPASQDESSLLKQLRTAHPLLLRLKAELHALENQVKQEQTRWLPNISGRAYWGTLGPSLDQQTYIRDGGVMIQATVLERMGAAIPLRVAEKQATVRQKQAELMEAQRRLETDLIQSRLDAQALLDNLEQTTQEKKLAEQNYQQALERYRKDDIPFVTVTDAQESLINARNSFVQTLFSYNRSQVRQVQSIGGLSPQLLSRQPAPITP